MITNTLMTAEGTTEAKKWFAIEPEGDAKVTAMPKVEATVAVA